MTTRTELSDTVHHAARRTGLDARSIKPLRDHASSVFLVTPDQVVARVSRDAEDHHRAQISLAITRWLVDQDFPTTAPADVDQPVSIGDITVTFWRYYPHDVRGRPPAAALGTLLRQLHQLPTPPIDLPPYRPLQALGDIIERSKAIPEDDQKWLDGRRKELLNLYKSLSFPLGIGFIHGDAYPGNTLWDRDRPLLTDWDEVATGPRELDLINTHQGARFGRTVTERQQFTETYGYDVTAWEGFSTLREMRDLHTLASYIRLADDGDDDACKQLAYRLGTLRAGDDRALWTAR